jgi:hypothetical protein
MRETSTLHPAESCFLIECALRDVNVLDCGMWIAAIEDADYREEKISFWDNVYGFDMTAIKKLALHEPLVDTVDAKVCESFINPSPSRLLHTSSVPSTFTP